MKQIIESTDGKFLGHTFDPTQPIMLNGAEFVPDKVVDLGGGITRYANSNYIIDTKEV